MLTRCRRGLVIVSNRNFLFGPGKSTLVGKLASGRPWIESTTVTERLANLPDARGECAPVYHAASSDVPVQAQAEAGRKPALQKPKSRAQSTALSLSQAGTSLAASPMTVQKRPNFDVKALLPRRYPHLEVGSTEAGDPGPSFPSQARGLSPLTSVPSRTSTGTVWDNIANTTVRTSRRQVQAKYGSPSTPSPQKPFERVGTTTPKVVSAVCHTSYQGFPPLVSTSETSRPSPTARTVQQSSGVPWSRVPGRRGMSGTTAQQTCESAWNDFVASRKGFRLGIY